MFRNKLKQNIQSLINQLNEINQMLIRLSGVRLGNGTRWVSTSSEKSYDVTVVGAGIVGLATAYQLRQTHPKLSIAVVEKESKEALHQSSRNSGVIHAGIYYKPGSDRARLCVRGLELMYQFLEEHKLPHKKTGKLIVALNERELPYMDNLYQRALQNKCPDIRKVSAEEIKLIEPHCQGIAAIHSPHTGIANFQAVANKLRSLLETSGVEFYFNFHTELTQEVSGKPSELVPRSAVHPKISSKFIIACAGLNSDRLAQQAGLDIVPRVVPFRGRWAVIKPVSTTLQSFLILQS
jgi:2-hydroxyglutarate dehydrogenase